jgi:heme exporter protein C
MNNFLLKFSFAILVFFILIAKALHMSFMVVPDEVTMGAIQRIFYFHVASATACYICFFTVFTSGMLFLKTKQKYFDNILLSAGEVGFVFCTIVLITGMIWGHTAWNTWFRFEPRLISFLIIWMMFLSFVVLRIFGDEAKIAQHSAVIGIAGAIMIPLMIYSIKLLPAAAQLHPVVIENRGLRHPSFVQALFWMTSAMSYLSIILIWIRFKIANLALTNKGI